MNLSMTLLQVIYVVLLKEKVFNPALPYEIMMTLTTVVLVIFGLYYYNQIKAKQQARRRRHQERAKFRRDLVFDYALSGSWTLKGEQISFSDDLQTEEWHDLKNISIENFLGAIKEDSQRALFQKMRENPAQALGQTFRLNLSMHADDHYSWWDMCPLMLDEEGLKGILVNVDQQKNEEEQLMNAKLAKDSVNLKETVLANMNHDIRSPLSAVVGYSELLSHKDLDIDEAAQKDYARIIKTNASLLLKLLDDAVNTNTQDLGTFKFHKTSVSVDKLFQDTFETNNILVPSNLKFTLQKGEPGLVMEMDKARIKQVLNNFLSNAIKFTEVGEITLGWSVVNGSREVEFYVEDTGCGISEEAQQKIFDRFYTTDQEHKGLGLGLNICRAIIEQHEGHISVLSEPGKGSRFSAFLKLQKGGQA